MKKRIVTKMVSSALIGGMALGLVGCGSGNGGKNSSQSAADARTQIESDSPYAGMDFDLSEHKTVIMYVLGDRPEDMDEVLAKANSEYFEPNLNTTLDLEFLNWSDYSTKYSLLLAGGDSVDLIYTAAWC